MEWLICIIYIFFVYGCSVIITQGIGPKEIFLRLRVWAESVGPNFGLLFRCMLCMPTNLGILFSIIFWFLFPSVVLTPGAVLLSGLTHSWYVGLLASFIDGCVCAGISHFIWNLDDFIDKSTPNQYIVEENGDVREVLED